MRKLARIILSLESIWIVALLVAFWHPSIGPNPPSRDAWLWLLWGFPVFFGARYLLYRRLWTSFPLEVVFLLLVGFAFLSGWVAPFRRAADPLFSFLILMSRPLMGIAICIYAVEYVRQHRKLSGLLWAALGVAALLTFWGFTMTQWNNKSDQLRFIIDLLPRVTQFPGANGGFNANELAFALASAAPLMAGLVAYKAPHFPTRAFRIAAAILFAALLLALVLGQSRFALAGVLVALFGLIPLVIRLWRWRTLAWAGVVALTIFEIMIIRQVFNPVNLDSQVGRDEMSASQRLDMWEQAVQILVDYPMTGVGLNMWRDGRVRGLYPVPSYTRLVLPHTHNAFLQVGTDLGFPGLTLFVVAHLIALLGLIQAYRYGDEGVRAVAAGVGAALVAQALYSLGDTVALWDRLSFIWFMLLALASAVFVFARASYLERGNRQGT
ncbi:MAG: O-antigen ligase family protein [Anaerolineae bacterium]|nr:O-antigen ligase family protein [Anaerolineae bacterium]